ncbi:SemiSWEET family sugar transporter [Dongia sedimenti]|uniref:SemiSWEET transporter n=1 Tax=Dongia sedimenti TaxID=3064282 RepID=A0ABU0YMX0_9PROT|nr:SemiSWEET transporter [Rhodospirillaceae bacterium R-7]
MSSPGFWIEALGLFAACLTTSSFLPQAIRIWRTRSARDVSLVMYLMMAAGNTLWLVYGILIGSVSMIFANATCLLMVASVLVLKVRDMLQPNLLVEIVAAEAAVGAPGQPVNSNEIPATPRKPPAAA